jgi:uncharacterized protein YndB with AHSA1/START domain
MSFLDFEIDPDEPVIRFRRCVAATAETVFAAWTTPAALLRWWGPPDLPLVECTLDLRVGGSYRFVHRASDGGQLVFTGTYEAIHRPTLLRYTSRFEPWPDSAIDTVTFDERDGRSLIAFVSRHPSFESRDRWVSGGMEHGLNAAQHRLDTYLSNHEIKAKGDR